MGEVYEKLQRCCESVRQKTDFVPKVALVLGSGLGDFAETIRVVCEISYGVMADYHRYSGGYLQL